jgi:bleomycin hydrolase
VVPKSVFPETYSSSNSGRLDWLVTVKLREFATKIRDAVSQNVPARQIRIQKEEMLQDIFRILAICLGEPPTEFEWEFYDKNGKYHHAADMTPQVFMKQIIGYPVCIGGLAKIK